MNTDWDSEIGLFLQRLSETQRELLSLLANKRRLLQSREHTQLAALVDRERELAAELQACHDDRSRLLERAEQEGIPAASIGELDRALASHGAGGRASQIRESRQRAELIRHDCLSQWVAIQRTLLHLSQMLEIIATGGRLKPTYGSSHGVESSGALMDQAV